MGYLKLKNFLKNKVLYFEDYEGYNFEIKCLDIIVSNSNFHENEKIEYKKEIFSNCIIIGESTHDKEKLLYVCRDYSNNSLLYEIELYEILENLDIYFKKLYFDKEKTKLNTDDIREFLKKINKKIKYLETIISESDGRRMSGLDRVIISIS